MFGYMAEVTLSEYIRRRRMSLAASDLKNTEARVIDIALKYGYMSPTAFNRAFQSVHGVTPTAARGEEITLKAYPPLSFKITVKGVTGMDYRIEKREAFRIIGVSEALDVEMEKNFETVPRLWQSVAMNGTIPRLLSKMDGPVAGLLGVSTCGDDERWQYFIAVSSYQEVDEDWSIYTVPAYTWAIFNGQGKCPEAIQQLEQRIITEWLPTSGYEYDDGPDVEVYLNADPMAQKFEVWIPVRKG